ncbi:hypothetical protein [Natronomonas sp.]|uniref:hypothetical protein n=1 Tax=Natronomonas sp. TaxID=2184060 RepID=UPI00260AFB54|nr:hypothetical protein [Natronomonas sp.]
MSGADNEVRTWLDDVAVAIGFGKLASKLPISVAPSTLFVGCGLFVDTILLQLFKQLTGRTATVFNNPFWLAIPVAVIAGLYINRELSRRYQTALSRVQINQRVSDAVQFDNLVSKRVRWLLFILSAGVIIINAIYFITIPTIVANNGPTGLIGNLVIVPFVYTSVIIDFIATYLGIQLILPRRLYRSEFELDFLDPERLGGLRPVGELVKHSYYYTVFGIVAFALFVYGPQLFGDLFYSPVQPSPLVNGLFTTAWLAGAAVMGYGLWVFHRFMRQEKAEKLQELNREYREVVEQPWDITNRRLPDSERDHIADLERRMDNITSTKEYPATFAMWTQLLIGIVLPKGVQLVLTTL